ncbi:hypothetical protein LCGC14_2206340, partial [marine sediment metagenome]
VLGAPPYGWPRDAINGALLVLLGARQIRAERDGVGITTPKELPQTQIGKSTFHKEDEPPSTSEIIAVRGLLSAAGIRFEPEQEGASIPALLQSLIEAAERAGGPPPLPERPRSGVIDELRALGGNQQFRAVSAKEAELRDLNETWTHAAAQRNEREAEWSLLRRLMEHTKGLSISEKLRPQKEAIEQDRLLLKNPDPVRPLIDELNEALRSALTGRIADLKSATDDAVNDLADTLEWQSVDQQARDRIRQEVGLAEVAPPDVSTDAALIAALDKTSLGSWDDRIQSVGAKADNARQLAAQIVEPKSVSLNPPPGTLKTAEDVDRYLAELQKLLMAHIDADEIVVV